MTTDPRILVAQGLGAIVPQACENGPQRPWRLGMGKSHGCSFQGAQIGVQRLAGLA